MFPMVISCCKEEHLLRAGIRCEEIKKYNSSMNEQVLDVCIYLHLISKNLNSTREKDLKRSSNNQPEQC